MYKAIKDNKIIAIANKKVGYMMVDDVKQEVELTPESYFPLLNYDEIIEDTEHTVDDYDLYYYEEYKAEYLLKSEIPAPTKEEQQAKRKAAYEQEIDELHSQKMRHEVLGDWTAEDEAEYVAKVTQLSQEIAERYPYPVGE